MSIGENIRRMRKERNMTQEQLGKEVAVSLSMISQIERGTKALSIQLAKEIANVFGCTTDDFFKG